MARRGSRDNFRVIANREGNMSADDRVWAVTLLLAQHHRLDRMGRNDRCTCGFKTELGRMFSEHIAKLVDAIYYPDSEAGQ